MAARSRVRPLVRAAAPKLLLDAAPVMRPAAPQFRTTDRLIAIGSSAGGTEALRVVLEGMPADAPAVVMTQHLPASFSSAFAERLDRHWRWPCARPATAKRCCPYAYLPPGAKHLRIIRDGARWRCASTTVRQ